MPHPFLRTANSLVRLFARVRRLLSDDLSSSSCGERDSHETGSLHLPTSIPVSILSSVELRLGIRFEKATHFLQQSSNLLVLLVGMPLVSRSLLQDVGLQEGSGWSGWRALLASLVPRLSFRVFIACCSATKSWMRVWE